MYNDEIFKLSNKLQELKYIYEKTKKSRENLVMKIDLIDQKLEIIEEELRKIGKKHVNEILNKERKSNILKSNIKQFLIKEVLAAIIVAIITFVAKHFVSFSNSFAFISIIHIIDQTIIYRREIKKIPKYRQVSKQEIENLEKELKKTLEKRLELGSKYKSYWEAEKKAHNIYITMKELLTERINYLKSLKMYECKQDDKTYMNDIYYKIEMNPQGYFQSSNTKKDFLDEELNRYFKEKLAEINYNIVETGKLDSLTTEELYTVLANYIPEEKHNTTLNHVIHAILGYVGNMQSYSIVWIEENDESLINNPKIIFDVEGRWNQLKTHKNTDYMTIFNTVYSTFIDKFMTAEKITVKEKIIRR